VKPFCIWNTCISSDIQKLCCFTILNAQCTNHRMLQVLSSSWDGRPFGHNRHRPKTGGCARLGEGRWVPSNTTWPGPRPTSLPSAILIHAPFGHSRHGPKIGELCPFGQAQLGPHLTQCGQGRGLPLCQVSAWSIQPFGRSTQTSQTGHTDNGPIV